MIGIVSVTEKGDKLADKIQSKLGGVVIKKSESKDFNLDNSTAFCFEKFKLIVFVSSTGIAVRGIAKYLKGKAEDPGIVVVDVCNNFTISLISGHLGGANRLTNEISKILENTPVITTATDNLDMEAPDMVALNNNLIIEDLKKAKDIASRLVNNEEVYFIDDRKIIECPRGYIESERLRDNTLWITNKDERRDRVLKLIRKDIVLGIGCRRDTESEKLYKFIEEALKENNISLASVKIISSIDIKIDEKAILDLAENLKANLKLFSKEEISRIEDKYEGSTFVKKTVGVKAVSEPVVELTGAKLIVNKIKKDGMTLSIGCLI
ncbi:cobalt-precorrin 5A hydrolase [Clostridium paraputrificum]|uniref:cobalt-precorrin 5A hydrolase n=1 Tax=Clostridium paraputrificum TaxID=29363 RepID=UPI003D35330C